MEKKPSKTINNNAKKTPIPKKNPMMNKININKNNNINSINNNNNNNNAKTVLKKSRSPVNNNINRNMNMNMQMMNLMNMGMGMGFGSIFADDLPMHRPGEIPELSRPIHIKSQAERNRVNPRTQPVEFLQNFFAGFGIAFPGPENLNNPDEPKYKYKQVQSRLGLNNNNKNNNTIKKTNTNNSDNKNINTINNNNNNINSININNNNNNNINNYNNNQRIRLNNIRRHNFTNEIYDQSFNQFGSSFDDDFRNNYSSNFRSNLDREAFDYLLSLIRGNRVLVSENKHPPTKPEVLKKLKKFEMSEKYCKKTENNQLEYPNCCICLADIILKQRTVLLPCGHLLHWKCGELWLKKQNTCPVCRFELTG